MKLVVTGASGFLGRHVVREAVRRGHSVRALVRPTKAAAIAAFDWVDGVEVVVADLRSRADLAAAVAGDAVLHLAAAKDGDIYAQYGGTVVATENLLAAMDEAEVRRIVHVSSLSVYDYERVASGSLHDETAPLEQDAFARDAYARAKLVQERLVREHATEQEWIWTVLRPGVIIGRDNLWSARIGAKGERFWLQIGSRGELPITYVENAAEAVVLAAESAAANGQIFDVIDDEKPTRRQYLELLGARVSPRPRVICVPWSAVRATASLASLVNERLLRRRARLPGMLIPCRVHARFKPLRFSNARIKQVLGWRPRYSLREAIDRSVASSAPANDTEVHADPAAASLRIAYMTGEFPRATDTFIQREIAALRRRGLYVESLAVRRPNPEERSREPGGDEYRTRYLLPAQPLRLAAVHLGLLAKTPSRYLAAARLALATRPPGGKALLRQAAYFLEAGLVVRLVRAHELSHLHNHFAGSSCSVAMLAAALGGFGYSFTVHGPADFDDPTYWRLDEKIRRAAFVVCISDHARRETMAFAAPLDADKLLVVHCGVHPDEYQPRSHTGRGRRVLFVGRLVAAKGVAVLLEAMARLIRDGGELELCIVGDGPDRGALTAQAVDLGIAARAHFRGYLPQSEVRELLASADVFALTSFAEGVPVVLMEAMAAGVPVVTTPIAGTPELVEDGVSGFLVPPGEAEQIAAAIARLLDDPALRNRFGAAGRRKIESEFDIAVEAERLHRRFEAALAAPTGRGAS